MTDVTYVAYKVEFIRIDPYLNHFDNLPGPLRLLVFILN